MTHEPNIGVAAHDELRPRVARINFVSTLPKDLWSGGFSAMNAAAFSAISAVEPTRYIGPINSQVILREKAISKIRRMTGLRGSFFFFSRARLAAIAKEFHSKEHSNAELDFFHGFTPWILTRPQRPYVAWSDCTFPDYIDIFCNRSRFLTRDLRRIEETEAGWLRNAERVLFTSDWAVKRALDQYQLEPCRVASVGIFGNVEMADGDEYSGGKNFVFVSTNFTAKGGRIVLSAFYDVRRQHSDATLTIVGDRPKDISEMPGTIFTGFLRKEYEHERRLLQKILSHAFALVHPTRSDVAPLLLVEAGYLGCPVISSRRFAIPELVEDKTTGILLDDPSDPKSVAEAMCWMLNHGRDYQQMRRATWAKARGVHSRSKFEQRLLSCLREVVSAKSCGSEPSKRCTYPVPGADFSRGWVVKSR